MNEVLDNAVAAEDLSKRDFLRFTAGAAVALGAATLPFSAQAATPASELLKVAANTLQVRGDNLLIRKADSLSFEEVVAWLKGLRSHPFVKQSGFEVTSVLKVRSPEGIFYVGGVNVENIELTVGTCAEEGAIAAAITALGEDIDILEGWVMGAPSGVTSSTIPCYPCGECRQRFAQYTAPEAPINIVTLDGEQVDTKTRAQLLPNAFSFRDLGDAALSPKPRAIRRDAHYMNRLILKPEKPLTGKEVLDWMNGLQSDARVSGVDRRIVFRLSNGAYVAGVKVENAAYPSSTTSVQTAISVKNARYGVQSIEEIWTSIVYRDEQMNVSQADVFPPMSGATLQVIYQFAASQNIPVNIFALNGKQRSISLHNLVGSPLIFNRFTS